jgi:hypothetical protein
MDTKRFMHEILADARRLMHVTNGDVGRAIHVALQDADAFLGSVQCCAAIDALGGHDAVVAQLTAELTRPLSLQELDNVMGWTDELPQRTDIEAQIAFEREYGAKPPQ